MAVQAKSPDGCPKRSTRRSSAQRKINANQNRCTSPLRLIPCAAWLLEDDDTKYVDCKTQCGDCPGATSSGGTKLLFWKVDPGHTARIHVQGSNGHQVRHPEVRRMLRVNVCGASRQARKAHQRNSHWKKATSEGITTGEEGIKFNNNENGWLTGPT